MLVIVIPRVAASTFISHEELIRPIPTTQTEDSLISLFCQSKQKKNGEMHTLRLSHISIPYKRHHYSKLMADEFIQPSNLSWSFDPQQLFQPSHIFAGTKQNTSFDMFETSIFNHSPTEVSILLPSYRWSWAL